VASGEKFMKALALTILMIAALLVPAFGESIVTLKSGEVLQGEILSDTNDVLQIRAFSHNHSISSLRDVSHTAIQSIQTLTPAQLAEQADYEALSKFQLNPNQEQSIGWYAQWIEVFKKFVNNYPNSDRIPTVQHYIQACQAET
jgi:hypothetical protein